MFLKCELTHGLLALVHRRQQEQQYQEQKEQQTFGQGEQYEQFNRW